jgi:hypothetical protein
VSKRARQIGVAWLLALSAAAAACAVRAQTLEYPIKAQFLYKFTPFIEWPPGAFERPTSPLVLCIVGRDPLGGALDRATVGQRLGVRPVIVLRLARIEPQSGCHLAYIAPGEAQTPLAAMQALHDSPVVTVTDEALSPGLHGMIHFVIRDQRVRFVINAGAAEQAGLKISSKLLALGVAQ